MFFLSFFLDTQSAVGLRRLLTLSLLTHSLLRLSQTVTTLLRLSASARHDRLATRGAATPWLVRATSTPLLWRGGQVRAGTCKCAPHAPALCKAHSQQVREPRRAIGSIQDLLLLHILPSLPAAAPQVGVCACLCFARNKAHLSEQCRTMNLFDDDVRKSRECSYRSSWEGGRECLFSSSLSTDVCFSQRCDRLKACMHTSCSLCLCNRLHTALEVLYLAHGVLLIQLQVQQDCGTMQPRHLAENWKFIRKIICLFSGTLSCIHYVVLQSHEVTAFSGRCCPPSIRSAFLSEHTHSHWRIL